MHEPTPLQNVEDFQSPIYQQTVQQMIDLMNARMWWYTAQQRDIIVRLVLQMIEFVVPNRAKIPALLNDVDKIMSSLN
jgi:hypothetical protein